MARGGNWRGTRRGRPLARSLARPPSSGSRVAGGVRFTSPLAAKKTLTRGTASRLALYRKRKNTMARQPPKMSLGGSGTFSNFGLTRRPSARVKTMKRVAAPNFDIINNSWQLKVSEGFQATNGVSFLNLADVTRLALHVPMSAPTGQAPKQFIIESCVAEFILTNSSLATAYVDIYDIVRKRDQGNNLDTSSPPNAWIKGVQNQDSLGSATAYQVINSLPTDSRLFNDYFHVKKRTHVSLAQGSTHRHMVNLKPNYLIDSNLIGNLSGDVTGLTVYTMVVAYGQPASVPSETGPPAVTTAAVNVDCVYSQRTKFTYVLDDAVANFMYDGLVSLTGEQIVSAGAGAIVPNAVV